MWCMHLELTDEVDGKQICLKCGVALKVPNVADDLQAFYDLVIRDHGAFGRHSKDCYILDGEWCCAVDCSMKKPQH